MSNKDKPKKIVEKLLSTYPECRENYNTLILTYLMKKGLLKDNIDSMKKVCYIASDLPALMSLGRVSAHFQNKENRFLPSQESQEKKEELNQEWRKMFRQ